MTDPPRTELDVDVAAAGLPAGRCDFVRDARLFGRPQVDVERLGQGGRQLKLAPGQLVCAPPSCDAVVRRGRLRVSEFLPDGREVTRAVLQAGSCFRTREAPAGEPALADRARAAGDRRRPMLARADTVIMAFDEAEIWVLPAGRLDEHVPPFEE